MVGPGRETYKCGSHIERTVLLLMLLLPALGESSYRNVNTKYGPVQGVLQQRTERLQPVAMFLGIPFATPPVGNLRFMPPVTVSPWKEPLLADRFGPVCPQNLPDVSNSSSSLHKISSGRLAHIRRSMPLLQNQSEDCLYLNVYVPASGMSLAFLSSESLPSFIIL